MGLIVMATALSLVAMGLYMAITSMESLGLSLFLTAMGVFTLLLGFSLFRMEVRMMPFRIYRQGFTLDNVSISQGLKREETLITFDLLKKVKVDSSSFYGYSFRSLELVYEDKLLREQTLVPSVDDNLAVMLAFRELVPDRLDKSLDPYIGPGAADKIFRAPFGERGKSGHDNLNIVMDIGMLVFTALMAGLLLSSLIGSIGLHWFIFIFPIAFTLVMSAVFLPMAMLIAEREFLTTTGEQARVSGDVVELPRPFLPLLFVRARRSIPVSEVKEVRRFLHSYTFGHTAKLVTVRDEILDVDHKIFEELEKQPDFEREEFVIINRNPTLAPGPPVVVKVKARAWAIAFSLVLLVILTGLVLGPSGGEFFDVWDVIQPIILAFVFLVLLPLYIVVRMLISKREAVGKGLLASDKGLTIPTALEPFKWVPVNHVKSARVEKDFLGYYLMLTTAQGQLKLPASSGEKLKAAGYPIDDPDGIIQTHLPVGGTPSPARGVTGIEEGFMEGGVDVEGPPSPVAPIAPVVEGPGELLSETPAEEHEKEMGKAKLLGVALMAGGVIMVVLSFLYTPSFFADIAIVCQASIFTIGILVAIMGMAVLQMARKAQPMRIYENGVEWYTLTKGYHFLPWGRFTSCEEMEIMGTKALVLKMGERQVGSISEKMPRFIDFVELIMERVSDPAYEFGPIPKEGRSKYVVLPMIIAVIGALIGLGLGWLQVDVFSEFSSASDFVLAVLIGIPMAMVIFFFILGRLMTKDFFGFAEGKLSTTAVISIVLALLVVFGAAIGASGPDPWQPSVEIITSSNPGESILDVGTYLDQVVNVSGPVTVQKGEILTLKNSTLNFDPAPGLDYGVWVAPGGRLVLIDSTVQCSDNITGFTFEVHGTALIEDSCIIATAVDPDHENGEGGVEIYNDDVRLVNTTFDNALSASIMTVECSPVIEDCVFTGAKDEGIESHGGSPVIRNCTFRQCEWPIILWGSDATIENSTFEECPRGVVLIGSSPKMEDCAFKNITEWAVQRSKDSNPELSGNSYENVGAEMNVKTGFEIIGTVCMAVTFLIAIIGLAWFWKKNKDRPDKTKPEPKD
jgi:hypothetical protein